MSSCGRTERFQGVSSRFASDKVLRTDESDADAGVVHHRGAGDLVFQQLVRRRGHRLVGRQNDNIVTHDIAYLQAKETLQRTIHDMAL
jgi:hypothetical protein